MHITRKNQEDFETNKQLQQNFVENVINIKSQSDVCTMIKENVKLQAHYYLMNSLASDFQGYTTWSPNVTHETNVPM